MSIIQLNNPLTCLELVYKQSLLRGDHISTLEFAMPGEDIKELYGLLLIKSNHLKYKDGIFYYRDIIINPTI